MTNELRRTGWAILALVMGLGPFLLAAGAAIASIQSTFDANVTRYERAAVMEPTQPSRWFALAKLYADKVRDDPKLTKRLVKAYLERGLKYDDRALAIDPDYYDALMLKSALLRQQAALEADAAVKKHLNAQADMLKQRAAAFAPAKKDHRPLFL